MYRTRMYRSTQSNLQFTDSLLVFYSTRNKYLTLVRHDYCTQYLLKISIFRIRFSALGLNNPRSNYPNETENHVNYTRYIGANLWNYNLTQCSTYSVIHQNEIKSNVRSEQSCKEKF
uniref:Uncharacterized protein n=1 Tax=Cacopsylla melanoneura TaxID=428564 RepID=A0A8D8RGT9_9HEMI